MVRFTVLASGSKGNSTVVSGGRTRILVDAGLSCRELFRRMRQAGEEPETLDAIVVTHEHVDHINGLSVTARKLGIPVYFTEGTHRAWMRWLTPRRQMTYAQWMEQCRKQAAERQAEADAVRQPKVSRRNPSLWPTAGTGPEQTLSEADQTEAGPEASPAAAAGRIRRPPALKKDPTWLPSVEYFQAGQPFEIGDIAVSPFTISARRRRPSGLRLQNGRRADSICHRPGLYFTQRKGATEGRGSAAAGVEPRSGDAARRALSVVSEAAGALAGGSPFERGSRCVP